MKNNVVSTQGLCWIAFFSRWILGLIFLMAGWHKVFVMGADAHAATLFVEGYRQFWIPEWLLYVTGYVIPFLELAGGALLILGLEVRKVLVVLGALLVLVTYGHLLKEPFFDITTHIYPRLLLLLLLFGIPKEYDCWSLDRWLVLRHLREPDRD